MNKHQTGINGDLAPVILFVYNRPEHTRKTLEALNRNQYADRSILYVFADGPKNDAGADDLNLIERTRDVIRDGKWCKEVNLICREKNMNLEDNIIDGIGEVINRHGKAIILEDDLITSPYFLKYCNDGLIMYENYKQIYSINGFMFSIDYECAPGSFLSPYATSSWGWATWADRWNQLESEPHHISAIENNKFLRDRFNFGSINILNMLKYLKTWDARWHYTVFVKNGLGLFPTQSLVQNIGFDGSGTHSGNENLTQQIYDSPIVLQYQTSIDLIKYLKLYDYFKEPPVPIVQRIKNQIKKLLGI